MKSRRFCLEAAAFLLYKMYNYHLMGVSPCSAR